MSTKTAPVDISRAQQLWAEYQKRHDVSDRKGQAVGIDPSSGRVWFGESIVEISQQLQAEGIDTPLYFVRAGYDHYYRKGSRPPLFIPKLRRGLQIRPQKNDDRL
jgi:hypothetical protein